MIAKTLNVADLEQWQILPIGRQLENNYRTIIFDCTGFGEPVTGLMLVHQRSEDIAPYIVGSTSGNTFTWVLTDTDTAYSGYGQAELRITFDTGLAKSVVYDTLTMKSITAAAVVPPPLQSWYDALIDYIDDNSVTIDEVEAAIADYFIANPITFPVDSVNGHTGAVVLSAADVGALPSSTPFVSSFNGATGPVTYTAPVASVDGKTGSVTVLPTGGTTGQVLTKKTGTNYDVEWQTVSGGGAVSSVNGKTGAVTVEEVYWCTYGTTTSAEIETAIAAGYLPCVENGGYTYTLRYRNSATNHRFVCNYGGKERTIVCQSGVWADGGTLTFLTSAPVTSVNGQTGAVTTPNTTYSMSIANNAITLTPSTGAAQTVTPADATTTVAGYMSATDKLHLDAVYADYSSAITALGVE